MICFGEKTVIKHLKNVTKWCKGTKYEAEFEKMIQEYEKISKDKKRSFLA